MMFMFRVRSARARDITVKPSKLKYKGKSINDVLEMSVEEAMEFFSNIPKIYRKLKTLYEVGLGYIKLGQSCNNAFRR